jgi:hypothetical protein
MKNVTLYIASKYNPTMGVGAYAFCIVFKGYRVDQSNTYSKTTGIRMEMIACLEAINRIVDKYGVNIMISIHSKEETLVRALIRGGTRRSGKNTNQDLYDRGGIEIGRVRTAFIEHKQLDRKGLLYAESICEIAFRQTPNLVDHKEEDKPKVKPLF